MTTPHNIYEEFPDDVELIRTLRDSDQRFAQLLQDYGVANERVEDLAVNATPAEELQEVELRKRRMAIKDEIARMLAAAKDA